MNPVWILVSIVAVAALSITGVCLRPDLSVQILGFMATIIAILGKELLDAKRSAGVEAKVDTSIAKANTAANHAEIAVGVAQALKSTVDVIQHQTNDMNEKMTASARVEGYAAGAKSETDKKLTTPPIPPGPSGNNPQRE